MTVRPASLEAQRGVLSAVSAFETYMLWKVCGVVALADTFDLSIVERTRSHVVGTILEEHTSAINKYRDAVQSGRPLSGLEGEKFASRDNTKASLRFELKLPHDTPPYADRGLVDNELVRFVVKLLLLDNMVTLDTFSAVVALPQCPSMHWHRDVSDPFRRWATSSVEAPTPAPGLVAVVPLVNVSQQTNGPTEFLMGSHVVSDGRWDTDDGDGAPIDAEVRPLHLALDALAGSAVLFDLRLRHRGGANPSEDVRPVLYLGFALSWFADGSVSNFQTAHTARWAREPSATRRALYSRLDTAEYTRRLESELQQRGVDLGELKARGEATAANPVAGTQLHL